MERNWHKHVAIGTYVLVLLTGILIALGILTFLHPPDPQHPMSINLTSLSIPAWLGAAVILVSILGTTALIRWNDRRSVRGQTVSAIGQRAQEIRDLGGVFELHGRPLERRVDDPNEGIKYTAKVRLFLENKSNTPITVKPPLWLTSTETISVQCGPRPFRTFRTNGACSA